MAFQYVNGNISTGITNDFLAGFGNGAINNSINGGDGHDVIVGDYVPNGYHFITSGSSFSDFAGAYDIDLASYWTTSSSGLVSTGNTPRTAVDLATTAGETVFLRVLVGAGQTITIDADATSFLSGLSTTDTVVTLYDSNFNLIAANDDGGFDPGSENSGTASFLTYQAANTDYFYIQVSEFGAVPEFEGDERFLLNVSVTGHAATGVVGQGNDILNGEGGNDTIYGDGGSDTINGGEGDDIIYGGDGGDLINGSAGFDTVHGDAGDDSISAGSDSSIYYGDAGDDSFVVGLVGHTMYGGDGSDTLNMQNLIVGITFDLATGITSRTASNGEHFYEMENAVGGSGADTLTGTDGDNTLNGSNGDDILYGLGGNDFFIEGLGSGTNAVYGGSGNDVLRTSGRGVYYGDADNDTVFVEIDGPQIVNGGTGTDLAVMISIPGVANIVNLVTGVTNHAGLTLSGFENYTGGEGVDQVTGTSASNTLNGMAGQDSLYGGSGLDTLFGGADSDVLDGGLGNDLLYGGNGNDQYYVNAAGDVVDETGTDGVDTVFSTINFTLAAGVDHLTMLETGTARIGTGNADRNVMTGNALGNTFNGLDGADDLFGLGGNDILNGGEGTDRLFGGEGLDRLDGGAGADDMSGGNGNDTYVVDDVLDVVLEAGAGGTGDKVETSLFNYFLPDNVEVLQLTGPTGLIATGNVESNTITGTNYQDTIYGGAGIDRIDGANGNDTLLGEDDNDVLNGGQGRDTLLGGGGTDQLSGGLGMDTYTGGLGADRFIFDDGEFGTMSLAGADRITDFSRAEADKIRVSYVDANTANGAATDEAFSFIGTAAFSNVAGQLRYEVMGGASVVMGDQNGDALADFWIRVDGAPALISTDFIL